MNSRPNQNAKMNKTDERSLEERLDHLTTTVEAQQKLLDRFMVLYESEKLQSLSQREDEEKRKKDAIIAKDAEIDRTRREISKLKLAMERQTSIYVRDKMRWEQEQVQLQKDLERYKTLSGRGSTDNSSTQTETQISTISSNDAPKSQVVSNNLSEQHKYTGLNEFSSDFRLQCLDLDRRVGCKAARRYVCTVCNIRFSQKNHYDEHALIHASNGTVSDQVKSISAAFARNKRRQAILEEYQREFNAESVEPKVPNMDDSSDDSDSDDRGFKVPDYHWGEEYVEGVIRRFNVTSLIAAPARSKRKNSLEVRRNAFFAPLRNLRQKLPAPASTGKTSLKEMKILKSANNADQKQTVKPQIEKNKVLSPIEQAEIDKAVEAIYSLAQPYELVPDSTVEEKQQVKLDVVKSPKDEAEKKPEISTLTSEVAKLSLTVLSDSTDSADWRRNLQKRFIALLLRHPCTDSATCSIIAFRGHVVHANQCHNGPDCSWYICKRVQAKTEHLKTCGDKYDCNFCQSYICFNDGKMQNMMKVLMKGCPLSNSGSDGMSESMKGAVMTMVARLAVNYGLVGDEGKVDDEDYDDETPELEEDEVVDVETVSSTDEEEEDGEEDEEEWEVVEAERRVEVD